jgi:hypothetical protein
MMISRLTLTASVLVLTISACGCVSSKARDERHPTLPMSTSTPQDGLSIAAGNPAPEPRIQEEWQKLALKDLESRPAGTDLWGLFSTGGWGDDGQTVAFREPRKTVAYVIEKNARERLLPSGKELSGAVKTTFESAVSNADNLEDKVAVAMDALEYEYLHARKGNDGKTKVLHRMRFNFVEPQTPEVYVALRKAFNAIR